MKSDLTCPVEIVRVTIQRETEDTNENGQILCLIDFFNLSDKVIDSIQMNIICFDAEDQRLGGRLVRAGAHGEPRENFSGAFAPEHVENVARVEAAVEKVWYQDGVIWRREERNVREYSPNALPPGRELDRLRSVAGPDAVGYAREDDTVWLCVCGRANRTSDDRCLRCGRDRAHTVKAYSFAAIDSTLGRKERMLEEKTRETLRRSSEQTVQQMKAVQKKQRKQKKRLRTVITLLAFVALLLAAARWGAPYALSLYAGDKLDRGLAADAKELYALIDRYWPDEFGAAAGMDAAEQKIIDGLMNVGTDSAYEQAAKRAEAIGDTQRAEKAIIARAKLAIAGGDTDTAEALLTPLAANEEARGTLRRMIYDVAKAAKEHLEYPTAIERFGSLGDYEDAAAQKTDCIYLYGRQLMREGQYQAACDQFMLVSDTGDAIALIRQCRYALGLEKQQAGEYEAAAALFESLGVYEDAQTRGQICRYTPGFVEAKKLIDRGEIGELFFVETEYAHDYSKIDLPWRLDPLRHGFLGGGCHAVDLARWIAGDPTEVFAYANHKMLPNYPTDDCTIAIMKFPNNVIGKVFVSTGCKRNYTMRSVFYGTKGTIITDNTSNHMTVFKDGVGNGETLFADLPQSHAIPIEYPVIVNNHNAAGELDEFVDCIVNDKPIHTTAVEGAKTVKASLAAVESSKTGMPVKIEYDF